MGDYVICPNWYWPAYATMCEEYNREFLNYEFLDENFEFNLKEFKKALDFSLEKKEEALRVFKRGARLAKGTTTETGLVQTYFANPFGPVQKREECDKLLDKYFDNLFENKVKVGTIKTQLGLNNMQFEGPRSAAIELFELIKNM